MIGRDRVYSFSSFDVAKKKSHPLTVVWGSIWFQKFQNKHSNPQSLFYVPVSSQDYQIKVTISVINLYILSLLLFMNYQSVFQYHFLFSSTFNSHPTWNTAPSYLVNSSTVRDYRDKKCSNKNIISGWLKNSLATINNSNALF